MKNPKILKVPYNFVPLNKKVVSPYWIDHISQDVPFDDAQSGTIEVKLTAQSPIFVKRGMGKEEAKEYYDENGVQTKPFEFEQDAEGNYIIPGSSLRGMVRSVLEVLSFGRMVGRVSERILNVRDLTKGAKNFYRDKFKPKTIKCGWMRKTKQGYRLDDCGTPWRISHDNIDDYFGTDFHSTFTTENDIYNPEEDACKTAQWKYDLFKKQSGNQELKGFFTIDYVKQDTSGRIKCEGMSIDPIAGEPMDLVLTGQPGRRTEDGGKLLEFVFKHVKTANRQVSHELYEKFANAYLRYTQLEYSEDFVWRANQLDKGKKIPVFFLEDDRGNITNIGLSYLFRLTYPQSIIKSIQENQNNASERDLADAIFGYADTEVDKVDKKFLRGRVLFSHAKAEGNPTEIGAKTVVLGEPRATFYPTYIQQPDGDGTAFNYKTLMMEDASLSGRKRYPVLADGITRSTRDRDKDGNKLSDKVFTQFKPLPKGTVFNFIIRYHNLRSVERGALLSALTFHGNEGCLHQIGMAKPLGYGSVKLEPIVQSDKETLLGDFEAYMNISLKDSVDDYHDCEQIQELVCMATPVEHKEVSVLNHEFPYNRLNDPKNSEEKLTFRDVKNEKEILPLHSQMHPRCRERKLKKWTNQDSLQKMNDRIDQEQKDFQSLPDKIEKHQNNTQKTLRQKLDENIHVHLRELQVRKIELERQEKAIRDADKLKKAGIDFCDLNPGNPKVFDEILKRVERFLREKKLLNQLLPKAEADLVRTFLLEVVQHSSKKVKRKDYLGKQAKKPIVARWLGDQETDQLFNEFKNL